MKLTDIRGLPIAELRVSRTNNRRIALDQHDSTIGIPVDSLTHIADQLVDLAESLNP